MIFPFVSRQHYNAVVRMQDQTIDRLATELQSMTARYHQLRVQGFTAPQPVLLATPGPSANPVTVAIARMSNGSARLADQMRRAAEFDRLQNVSDEDIARRIYAGAPTDDRAEV